MRNPGMPLDLGMINAIRANRSAANRRINAAAVCVYHQFYDAAKTSLVCMMASTDFIKTSAGKETANATLPITSRHA